MILWRCGYQPKVREGRPGLSNLASSSRRLHMVSVYASYIMEQQVKE